MVSSQPNRAFDTQYSPKIAEGLYAVRKELFLSLPLPSDKGQLSRQIELSAK